MVSLVTLLRWLSSDQVDPLECGVDWTDQIERGLTRSMQAREADGDESRYYDLSFQDFMSDPIECVRRIYAWAGRELSETAEQRMRGYVDRYSVDEHGRHRYRAEDYGLVSAALHERFASYMERFDIPAEG